MDKMDHIEEDADIFERAVRCLLAGQAGEAAEVLSTLAKDDPVKRPRFESSNSPPGLERAKRENLNNAIRARVYRRDGWRCRYCRRKLVVPGILELITTLCPGFNGLRPGHHMPYASTELAVERVYPNVDHVHAVAKGGPWLDEANHVTACTPCNASKNDRSGWVPGEIVQDGWDGLTSLYRALAERVVDGRQSYHVKWFRDIEI